MDLAGEWMWERHMNHVYQMDTFQTGRREKFTSLMLGF